MNHSRVRALKLNMLTGWAVELFTLISGLILPRLVLEAFGSEANGLVNSIGQYLGFAVVLRAGLGNVTRAALYKPLADGDMDQVSAIMAATQSYMRKIALCVVGYVLAIALVFPFLAKGGFDWDYMFFMVLIIGAGSVAENLYGIQAKIMLQADQKYYIQTFYGLLSQVLIFGITILLIKLNVALMPVKVAVTFCAAAGPFLLNVYVRRKYKLNPKAKPDNLAIKQRWDAFAEQVAVIVNDNIALTLLTVFVNLKEISVYTVHNMVVLNIKKLVSSCVTGINSTFGDMIARNEKENLQHSFRLVEWVFFALSTVIFSVTAIMLTPFVGLYTDGITDVNYIRPAFAVMLTVVSFVLCIRTPYTQVVEAAGHFKQTKWHAFLEVGVNIGVSVILVWKYGMIGVIIGTLVASLVRAVLCAVYSCKYVLFVPVRSLLRSFGIYLFAFLFIILTALAVGLPICTTWLSWCLFSAASVLWSVAVVLVITLVNNREQLVSVIKRLRKK